MKNNFDVIVIGGGHAGVEAGLACSRMNLQVLLATTRKDRISYMACNPAIGGLAKGGLVKEIDVLGGLMGLAGDFSCLQYKHLNSKKGPAVRGSRTQCDKYIYQTFVQNYIQKQKNITILEEEIFQLWIKKGVCQGVIRNDRSILKSKVVILTTGTFMGAIMHIGAEQKKGGRIGDQATSSLSQQLENLGFKVTRLKTGTPPRLHKDSIDWNQTLAQKGDENYRPLSFFSPKKPRLKQVFCYLTHTNSNTHEIIQKNLKTSPLFSGALKGTGPRYCPSIEDKVTRFPEKISHQTFLEPEYLNGVSIYIQGISTSLPRKVQESFIRTIKGLKRAQFLQWGYAVEYDFINPLQLWPTLETKLIPGLFLAGQVNGSSGYEEAGAQGLLAGINASAKILNLSELILPRHTAYTGVLIDDLTTKGTKEPYRMLTSRAEHRLLLREDNVAERLFPIALKYNLLPLEKIKYFENVLKKREQYKKQILKMKWNSKILNKKRSDLLSSSKKNLPEILKKPFKEEGVWSAYELLKRPGVSYKDLECIELSLKSCQEVGEPVEIEIKYEGYIHIQNQMIKKNQKMNNMKLERVNYEKVKGLSLEAREKLQTVQPKTMEQAQRISGVSPSALQALIIHVHQQQKREVS